MPIIEIWQHKKSSKGRWLGTSAGQCQSYRPTTSRWHCHSAWWYSSLPYKEHIHKLILPPYRPASRRSVGWKGCLLWNNNPIEPILVRLVLLVLMVATLGQTQLHRSKHKIIIIHTQEAGPRVMSDKWRCSSAAARCGNEQRITKLSYSDSAYLPFVILVWQQPRVGAHRRSQLQQQPTPVPSWWQ